MQHVLLTGASGFLGSHLLESLLEQHFEVTILKRSTSDTWRINHLLNMVRVYDADSSELEDAFKTKQVDVVIHAACSYGRNGQSASEVVESNLVFGLKVLDAAIKYKAATFLNADTMLPKFLNTYSLTKKHFSEWLKLRSEQIKVINLKIEHMYGPNDDHNKFITWVISGLQQGVNRIALTEGRQLRDFIHVNDVVAAYILLLSKRDQLPSFSEFDVGSGHLISVRDFVTCIAETYKHVNPLSQTVLGFGDIPLRDGELMSVDVDNSALKQLGWRPTTLVDRRLVELFGDDA